MEPSRTSDRRPPGIELQPGPDELPGNGRIVIAFSGGPDSVCLAALVARARPRRPVTCVHVDHQLDPDSGTRAGQAARIAEGFGLDCRIERVQPDDRDGPEASARRARYRALATQLGPEGVLLTAHHADDQTETILLRLLRGAGPDGLAGIPPQRRFGTGWIVRPLLDHPRERIITWLRTHRLDWIEDPGNRDRRFDRNVLRHDIMPQLRQRWPGVDRAIRRSGSLSRGAAGALAELAAADLERCRESSHRLRIDALLALSPFRRASAIRRWCLDVALAPPPGTRLDELLAQIDRMQSDRCPELRWNAHALRAWRGRLWLEREPPHAPDWSATWCGDRPLPLPEPIGRLTLESPVPVCLPRLEVCLGTPGEALRLPGTTHRKAVKNLMRAASVPPWQRALWPRLWRDGELLAVGGRWLSPGFSRELERHGCHLVWESALATAGLE